jgi:hypothetical protein
MKYWEIVWNSEDWRLIWRPRRARIQNPYQEPDQECISVQAPLRQKVPVPSVPGPEKTKIILFFLELWKILKVFWVLIIFKLRSGSA